MNLLQAGEGKGEDMRFRRKAHREGTLGIVSACVAKGRVPGRAEIDA